MKLTSFQKYQKLQELNKFLQAALTLSNRYEKQGRKEVAGAILAVTSAVVQQSIMLLPVILCSRHHKPIKTDEQLLLDACDECMEKQTCPTCKTTYTNETENGKVEIAHLLQSNECLLCDSVRADVEEDRVADLEEIYAD